jgi:hypothetical protein
MKRIIRNVVFSLGLAAAALSPAQAAMVYLSPPSQTVAVGATFSLNLLGDFTDLYGGSINLGYNGNLLQINSVTVDAITWEFFQDGGSQTATGANSVWSGIAFNTFSATTKSGAAIPIATLSLTALAAGTSTVSVLGSSQTYDFNGALLSPSLGTASITAPLPTAVWLFASGLLGLVGIARRHSRGGI